MAICDGIWAHWNCDEVSGARLDSSGNNHTLVELDGSIASAPGKISEAVQWLEAFQRFSNSDILNWDAGFALAFWTYTPLGGVDPSVDMYLGDSSSGDFVVVTVRSYASFPQNTTHFVIDANKSNVPYHFEVSYNQSIVASVWHLCIFNVTPTGTKMLIDNSVSVTDLALTSLNHINTNLVLIIGSGQAVPTIMLDELSVWERPLTDAEMTLLWNNGAGYAFSCVTPPTPVFALNRHTLVQTKDLMEGRKGWFFDRYTPNILCHYGEEGSNVHDILCGGVDGGVYQLIGNSDAGVAVPCQIITSCRNQGDPRINKLYGDIMVDCDTKGSDINAIAQLDNASVTGPATVVNTASRSQVAVPVDTAWKIAKNINLDLQWNMNGSRAEFFIWEPRYTEVGANMFAFSWSTSYISHGMPGYFYHGYLYLAHNSTADLTFSIIGELGTVVTSVTIPNSGGEDHKDFIRLPPTKGKLFKYTVSSTVQFRVFGEESELLVKPWGMATEWASIKLFEDVPKEG